MGFSDKLKQLGDKAKEAAAEHKDQIGQAVESAAVIADKRTHGRYRDKIAKATEKTGVYVDRLAPEETEGQDGATPPTPGTPPAGQAPPAPGAPEPTAGG